MIDVSVIGQKQLEVGLNFLHACRGLKPVDFKNAATESFAMIPT